MCGWVGQDIVRWVWHKGVALSWVEGLGGANGEGRVRTHVFVINSKVEKKDRIYIYKLIIHPTVRMAQW